MAGNNTLAAFLPVIFGNVRTLNKNPVGSMNIKSYYKTKVLQCKIYGGSYLDMIYPIKSLSISD
ncbi:hypothetical protein EG344_23580 [Chryseobacterium sp. G0162]|nr:hypothetical protein EG344_23580 [Chryseobacterium sp. G0162]